MGADERGGSIAQPPAGGGVLVFVLDLPLFLQDLPRGREPSRQPHACGFHEPT